MSDPYIHGETRASVGTTDEAVELIGRSPAIVRVQELIRRGAPLDGGVADQAPNRAPMSSRSHASCTCAAAAPSAPFVTVHCDAGDPATVDRRSSVSRLPAPPTDLEPIAGNSCIAAARGGTLYLHNVTELRASTQAQLARIARDGEVRVDGEPVPTAIRFVASAHPGIDGDVHAHRFRGDLYRRLSSVVRIDLPPLRDRPDDVPALAVRLLDDACAAQGRPPRTLHPRRAGAVRRVDLAGQSRRAAHRDRPNPRRRGGRRHPDRTRPPGAAAAIAPTRRSCRRATCGRRGSASSATTSPRCSSITSGGWPRPLRRWGFSVRICIERPDSWASRWCGCSSSNGTTSCARITCSSLLALHP